MRRSMQQLILLHLLLLLQASFSVHAVRGQQQEEKVPHPAHYHAIAAKARVRRRTQFATSTMAMVSSARTIHEYASQGETTEYPQVQGVIPLHDIVNRANGQPQTFVDPWTFAPGNFRGNAKSTDGRLLLSDGLTAKPLAKSGEYVVFPNGKTSVRRFISKPNGGALFPKGDGGWLYLTNSGYQEYNVNDYNDHWNRGGVAALEFDIEGDLTGYHRLLSFGTPTPCSGGGMTPWNSFITCEPWGCRQVDPFGKIDPMRTAFAFLEGLNSFAYDTQTNPKSPQFFVSRNDINGTVMRLSPGEEAMACYNNNDDQYAKWCSVASGVASFLVLYDDDTFEWVDRDVSLNNNMMHSPTNVVHIRNATYIAVHESVLYVVSTPLNKVYCCDLERHTYYVTSSAQDLVPLVGHGGFLFQGGPHVFGRHNDKQYYTLIYTEAFGPLEKVSVVFSPNRMHMYVAYETVGLIYDVTRIDGEPFDDEPYVDITYSTLVS